MPRVKESMEREREKKRVNYVAGMLSGGLRQKCLSFEDVGKKMGVCERTVANRMQHLENIKLADLYRLADIAGISISFEFKDIPD